MIVTHLTIIVLFYQCPEDDQSTGRNMLLNILWINIHHKIKMHVWGLFFFYWRYNPLWVCILQPSYRAIASSHTRFLDHTQRRATVGKTPLDEWSDLRRDLYLTTHNTHNRKTSMPPVGFEPTISAGERP